MIESPKNFIEQFQNFIEHIAGLMKTFLTKEVADNYYLGKTAKAVNAGAADKATRDANNNVITSTYATKTEVTSGLSGKLGKTEKASSASTADAVAWTGVSGKPNFATVATTGSYNDLKNKPTISSIQKPRPARNRITASIFRGGSYQIPQDALANFIISRDDTDAFRDVTIDGVSIFPSNTGSMDEWYLVRANQTVQATLVTPGSNISIRINMFPLSYS